MSYKDSGFDKFLYRNAYGNNASQEMTEDRASYTITTLTGSSIAGGITKSQDGKMEIDWDKGQIVISDGAYPRIVIGQVD